MKCPNCGSENVNYITNTTTKGFGSGKACCGFLLWGWIGVLCGLCGMGKQNTKEYWICNNCGNKFQSKDIKKMDKKTSGENFLSKAKTLLQNTEIEQSPKLEPIEPFTESSNIVPVTPQKQNRPVPQENKPALFEAKTIINRTSKYNGTLSVEELLKRAKIFIEDKDWEKAYEYCQNALDVDAGCADAYFALFMAEYNISDENKIPFVCGEMAANLGSLFMVESYKKASLFGNDDLKAKLEQYNQQAIYNYAVKFSDNCTTPEECDRAKVFFRRIRDYPKFMDVTERIEDCDDKKNALIYGKAVSSMNLSRFEEAITFFERIPNYNDSQQKVKECKDLINQKIYDSAVRLLNNYDDINDVVEAKKKFLSISEYKDAEKMAERCSELRTSIIYNMACDIMDDISCEICIDDVNIKECISGQLGDIKDNIEKNLFLSKTDALHTAKDMFMSVSEYIDSKDKAEECDKKIEVLRNEYDHFVKTFKTAVIVLIACVMLLCIIIPVVRNISDRKASQNTVVSAYEYEMNEKTYTSALSDTQQQSASVSEAAPVEYDKSLKTDELIGEFVVYDDTYDSDTIDYIGTYDGWTYFSDVTDIVIKTQLYLYGTVYFCDVSINRINIETGVCEHLIRTCCSSAAYDDFTQYYNYDFTINDIGKLVFAYDDPNTFKIISSIEYGGKESYNCNSYILCYDVNTTDISQISAEEAANLRPLERISNDDIERYLPQNSVYIGEKENSVIYEKDMFICLTNDYKNADLYSDRIFDLKVVRQHERETYESYGFQDEFDDIGVGFYYDISVCGKWIIIKTLVTSVDIYFENQYYLNPETGICYNLPITDGTGQYKDVSNYISNYNEADDFEFSIGYVTIDFGVLNVRSEPYYDSNIIGTLENNAKVEIYEYENGWYFIYYYDYYTNLYGYVSSDYITVR